MPTIFSSSDIDLLTPEDISLDEIDAAFSALDNDRSGLGEDLEDNSSDAILAGNHYDLDELEPALTALCAPMRNRKFSAGPLVTYE